MPNPARLEPRMMVDTIIAIALSLGVWIAIVGLDVFGIMPA